MDLQAHFSTSLFGSSREAAEASGQAAVVPMYTPLWYATRVLKTTANDWWDEGVPPSRRRGQRATQAVATMAAHFSRRLHAARSPAAATERSVGVD